MRCRLRIPAIVGALTMVALSATPMRAAATPFFMSLGSLDTIGTFNSSTSGVSADGAIVVGTSISPAGFEAFRWTQGGGMVGLGDLAGGNFLSVARGVSASGAAVVGFGSPTSDPQAFRWTQGGGMVALAEFRCCGVGSDALGITADGAVIVGSGAFIANTAAFRWTQGGGVVALTGGGFFSEATAVSAGGAVLVGTCSTNLGPEAFRWSQSGGMVGLGDLAGGAFESVALGVSADGGIVVGQGNSALGDEAFVWDAVNGTRNLGLVLRTEFGLGRSLIGWTLVEASGVSADGLVFVGFGKSPRSNREAWIANLRPDAVSAVPEPATLMIFGVGVLGVMCRRKVVKAAA